MHGCSSTSSGPRAGTRQSWLLAALLDWHRRRVLCGSGDSAMRDLLDRVPAPEDPLDDWDRDYERRVFAWAAERVRVDFRENTWRAFWLTAVEGLSADEAARALKMSLGAVHVARSRVMARLSRTRRSFTWVASGRLPISSRNSVPRGPARTGPAAAGGRR